MLNFTATVARAAKKVVFLDSQITQAADQAKIGSNTSLIGKNSRVSDIYTWNIWNIILIS